MITFDGVTKKFLSRTALENVTIEIPAKGVTGVVGENGSGKSTLLKLAGGLLRPDKGTVAYNGQKVSRKDSSRIAYLSENDHIYAFFRIDELIDYQASQFLDFNKQRAYDMLSFMNLDPAQKIKTLSKGNRGRVKIVITLAREAELLLLDEPLSGLDPIVRRSIIQSLVSFVDVEAQGVLISTHEVSEMDPLLDRVLVLRQQHVLDLEDSEAIREQFGVDTAGWMEHIYARKGKV
ncbi:ATP-binding cassette domain-containing protein [Marinococcus halotolerans]|uniref:ATP-binding cassette domain-containing protein n=1 Tax=Marinococcus halotolerans TaxID=301092 RepID=UPI0003B30350|nr:ABC transporter ATP-binding protein [Marinococcus halotolerans]